MLVTDEAMSQTSAASSATSRSSKFNLDENDQSSVLVYKWRGGLAVQSQADLAKAIDKGELGVTMSGLTVSH